jgi:hypothetical protein
MQRQAVAGARELMFERWGQWKLDLQARDREHAGANPNRSDAKIRSAADAADEHGERSRSECDGTDDQRGGRKRRGRAPRVWRPLQPLIGTMKHGRSAIILTTRDRSDLLAPA